MRIGVVVPGGVDRGGTHRVIPWLLEFLEELGRRHSVHVVALRQEPDPGDWDLPGCRVHNVGPWPRRLRALRHLALEHRRRPFDVLVGYALVPQGVVTAMAGRVLGIPWVAMAPGGEFADLGDIGFGGWRRLRGRAWIRLACRGAAACVVPSAAARALAELRGFDATHVPLPLSTTSWPRRRSEACLDAARLLWVGSLNDVKDPWLLLGAAAAMKAAGVPFQLDVVGEDTLAGGVERRAAALRLGDRVRFHGFRTQEQLRPLVRAATLLVVTSRFETGPRVVLEAASQGVPTVGTRVGYVDAWSPDAALATADETPAALARAVTTLLHDRALRLDIARAASDRLQEHDLRRVTDQWESILERAAGRKGGG